MSFVFVRRKYGGTKVGKAIEITEANKAKIKTETGVDVTIEDNGYAVVPHDGGYKLAKVGDYFISYTSEEGKSDSDVIDFLEYATMFEVVSSLKKPNPGVGIVSTPGSQSGIAGGPSRSEGGGVSEVQEEEEEASVTYSFVHTESVVSAQLNEDNNDEGHTFVLGTLQAAGGSLPETISLTMSDKSLSTYKLKLKKTTLASSDNGQVEAVLQRARKNQKEQVNHSCPVTLNALGQKFEFNISIDIQAEPQV